MRFTQFLRVDSETLEGLDPSSIHRMRSILIYTWCDELLKGVDPSRIRRMSSTLIYRCCGQYSKGVHS